MMSESYIKVAYMVVEEIEKPYSMMRKMIRKPLKSKGGQKKRRALSVSTQHL